MSPLEKLNACAARLVQEADGQHGGLAVRLKEAASTIRGAVATIRNNLESTPERPRHSRFNLIVGDEGTMT